MLKKTISIAFTILFLTTIVAPSIIIILDDTIDFSMLYDISEEEEEKSTEKTKELESFTTQNTAQSKLFYHKKKQMQLCYYLKKYTNPQLNLISPPPEFII